MLCSTSVVTDEFRVPCRFWCKNSRHVIRKWHQQNTSDCFYFALILLMSKNVKEQNNIKMYTVNTMYAYMYLNS